MLKKLLQTTRHWWKWLYVMLRTRNVCYIDKRSAEGFKNSSLASSRNWKGLIFMMSHTRSGIAQIALPFVQYLHQLMSLSNYLCTKLTIWRFTSSMNCRDYHVNTSKRPSLKWSQLNTLVMGVLFSKRTLKTFWIFATTKISIPMPNGLSLLLAMANHQAMVFVAQWNDKCWGLVFKDNWKTRFSHLEQSRSSAVWLKVQSFTQ